MGTQVFGFVAVAAMVTTYALEHRAPGFILAFAVSCVAASVYAVLIGSWPFALVEGLWSLIALWRWLGVRGRRIVIVP